MSLRAYALRPLSATLAQSSEIVHIHGLSCFFVKEFLPQNDDHCKQL